MLIFVGIFPEKAVSHLWGLVRVDKPTRSKDNSKYVAGRTGVFGGCAKHSFGPFLQFLETSFDILKAALFVAAHLFEYVKEHLILLTLLFNESEQFLYVGGMQQTLTQQAQNIVLQLPF